MNPFRKPYTWRGPETRARVRGRRTWRNLIDAQVRGIPLVPIPDFQPTLRGASLGAILYAADLSDRSGY
jgi:hypothetical protein